MNGRSWSREEEARLLDLRTQGLHSREIARVLQRSDTAVRIKLIKLGFSSSNSAVDESDPLGAAPPPLCMVQDTPRPPPQGMEAAFTSLDEDLARKRRELDEMEERLRHRKLEDALKAAATTERLVEVFRERIQESPASIVIQPPAPRITGSEEGVALAVLISDTHFGQVVSPEQTNYFGNYCPRIAAHRLYYLQNTLLGILQKHPFGVVDEVRIFLLGDIVHGALQHGAEREETALIADQIQLAVWLLYQFLVALAAVAPKVEIHTVVGNHGRLPSQRKMPTVARYSNFDQIVYGALHHTLAALGLPGLTFHLNTAPRQVVEIKGTVFHASHGDHLRGGDKQLAIPAHAMAREINATTQRHASAGRAHVDYYVCGDKHRMMSVPTARGAYLVNGCFGGVDEYSMSFTPNEAAQLAFAVHPRLRVTYQLPIKLEFAPCDGALPYQIPANIRHLVEDN